ncbi:MAG: zf-HC2 domain-containing protein [Candidatus Riflebacteria bacterium]|nr:zf-HC2 domain-containing protein [Candidatus Riflebacteria bacterium]
MKCPEKEQLMLFVDGELDPIESNEIRSHLAVCENCRHEVEDFRLDLKAEALLREKVSSAFEKRSVSNKIMEAIKAEPRIAASKNTSTSSSLWLNWFFKFMVPALAIAIALFMFFTGSSSQAPAKYTGRVYRISAMANNNESLVDGKIYTSKDSFDVSAESFKKLDGSFIVNVVTSTQFYTIGVEGKTDLSFDLTTMTPVFEDCKAKIFMLRGETAKLKINGNSFDLNSKNTFNNINEIAPRSLEINEKEPKPVKVEEKVEKVSETVATPTEVINVTIEENNNSNVVEEKDDSEQQVVKNSEESLTTESSSGISIIDTTSDYGEEEASSPFSERKLGGL